MKFLLSCFVLLLSTAALADNLKSNYVTFNMGLRKIDLNHNETSGDAGFQSLDKRSSFPMFSLKVGLEKEFLAEQVVSFNLGVLGGAMYGRKKDELVKTNLQFRDRASGIFYGLSGTINANFMINKMRSQVFGGVNIIKSNSEYRLGYLPLNSLSPSIEIEYEEDGTVSYLTTGMRFFDYRSGLFSVFAIDYKIASSYNTTILKSKLDGNPLSLSNTSTAIHDPFILSLGFGLMF